MVSGEIRTDAEIDFQGIARKTIREIGYTDFDLRFGADSAEVL